MLGHLIDDPFCFFDAPAKRHHDKQIRQSHLVTNATERRAFERKTRSIGGVRIACRAPKAQHRVFLFWLEALAAQQARIFVRLEIGKTHDDRLWIEGRRDRADAFSKPVDKIG